jgi:PHD/YefM family antitoxin component YafN of YafNO toxin-antitoxin module
MSTENSTTSRIVSAGEIKRRGLGSLDELLADGPVYVIRNGKPRYIVLLEDDYAELLEGYEEAARQRIKASLSEVAEGTAESTSLQGLIEDLDLGR